MALGSVWATDSWAADAWADGVWAEATVASGVSVLDPPMRGLAKNLARTFGKTATLTYVTKGAYNTTTGVAATTTSTASVRIVIEGYANKEEGLVEAGDIMLLIPAKGITEPKQDDKITIGSDVYHFVRVDSIWSGSQQALYRVWGRR